MGITILSQGSYEDFITYKRADYHDYLLDIKHQLSDAAKDYEDELDSYNKEIDAAIPSVKKLINDSFAPLLTEEITERSWFFGRKIIKSRKIITYNEIRNMVDKLNANIGHTDGTFAINECYNYSRSVLVNVSDNLLNPYSIAYKHQKPETLKALEELQKGLSVVSGILYRLQLTDIIPPEEKLVKVSTQEVGVINGISRKLEQYYDLTC